MIKRLNGGGEGGEKRLYNEEIKIVRGLHGETTLG